MGGKPLLSTTDWPSTVSLVVFFAGCNLRCRFCFNAPILEFDKKFVVELDNVFEELEEQLFLAEGIIVTGGEPTLQPEPLYALAEWTHNHNLSFGLMTNGTRPAVLKHLLINHLIDYIAVDIKTIPQPKPYSNITQSKEEILEPLEETITLIKSSKIHYEFRTTLIPQLVDQLDQIRQIIEWVGPDHFVLQAFRPTETVVDPQLQKQAFTQNEFLKFREFGQRNNIIVRF